MQTNQSLKGQLAINIILIYFIKSSNMSDLQLWKDQNKLDEVKKLFAPKLTEDEFKTFVWIGKATSLNPFLREIWAVKYQWQPASIFIGRDWYRKSAQSNKEYDYHTVDAVYSNDVFEVENWEVKHKYSITNRWDLAWAYCIVKRKWASKTMFNFVDIKEYNTNQSVWKQKPATMIKKVAEAQWLRWTFQELFAWTYDESEEIPVNQNQESPEKPWVNNEDQEKNFWVYYDKMMAVKNEDELRKVFIDLNKERKKFKDYLSEDQLKELVGLKDEIKQKINENIVEAEIIPEEPNKSK